ncbi:MAG: hypothetical protein IJ088_09500 [Clostridia bacterium]|nr:hypothetical protein [Clostridia bacterium]
MGYVYAIKDEKASIDRLDFDYLRHDSGTDDDFSDASFLPLDHAKSLLVSARPLNQEALFDKSIQKQRTEYVRDG